MYKTYISNVIPKNQYHPFTGLFPTWTGFLRALPEYVCKPRILDDYCLIFLSSGSGYFDCSGKSYSINTNDAFFLFPGVLHSYGTDIKDLMSQWWIGFKGPEASILLHDLGISPEAPVMKGIKNSEFLIKIDKIVNTYTESSPSAFLKASGSLYKLFGILADEHTPKLANTVEENRKVSKPIQRATSFIEANYPHEISLEKVASYCNLSRTWFVTRFKEELGISPSEYLSATRLNKSKQYLKDTELSIMEISYSVGFQDPQYFSRFFKKYEGMTPSEFRMAHQSS